MNKILTSVILGSCLCFKPDIKSSLQSRVCFLSTQDNGYFGMPTLPTVERFDEFHNDFLADKVGRIKERNYDLEDITRLKKKMKRQLRFAFEFMAGTEIDELIERVWSSNDPSILRIRLRLVELTNIAEELEEAVESDNFLIENEELANEIKIIRSNMRMYCTDRSMQGEIKVKKTESASAWDPLMNCFDSVKNILSLNRNTKMKKN